MDSKPYYQQVKSKSHNADGFDHLFMYNNLGIWKMGPAYPILALYLMFVELISVWNLKKTWK